MDDKDGAQTAMIMMMTMMTGMHAWLAR